MKIVATLVLALMAISCATTSDVMTRVIQEPGVSNLGKMAVIGATNGSSARDIFEERMQDKLLEYDINAWKSAELDPLEFSEPKNTRKELRQLTENLMDKGFDSFLVTEVAEINETEIGFEIYCIHHIENTIYSVQNKKLKVIWFKDIQVFDYYDIGVDDLIDAIITVLKNDGMIRNGSDGQNI